MRSLLALTLCVSTLAYGAPRPRTVSRGVVQDPALWLRLHAAPLESSADRADDRDLRNILHWFRGAAIVGLGDITHGNHEPYAIKQRLIPLLVRDLGFRVIAFEAPYAEFETIRDYVLTGKGDPAVALQSDDYYFWDTQEVLDVIEWARAENARGVQPPVEVVGVDTTHPAGAIARVLASLTDGALRAEAQRRYACLTAAGNDVLSYRRYGEAAVAECRAQVISVRPLLEAAGAGPELLYAARAVEQGEEALATLHATRDAAMAENIGWIKKARDTGVILWGHNEHLAETPYHLGVDPQVSTGTILAEKYGDQYLSVATIALQGTLWIYEYDGERFSLVLRPMTAPSGDDYASLFAASGLRTFALWLSQPLPSALAGPHQVRIGPSATVGGQATVDITQNLAERFDAVIYFETVTPSRLRHFPTQGP